MSRLEYLQLLQSIQFTVKKKLPFTQKFAQFDDKLDRILESVEKNGKRIEENLKRIEANGTRIESLEKNATLDRIWDTKSVFFCSYLILNCLVLEKKFSTEKSDNAKKQVTSSSTRNGQHARSASTVRRDEDGKLHYENL